MSISGWRRKRRAFEKYMADEIGVPDLSDDEREYIKRRLGHKLRVFRRTIVWLERKMGKLLQIVKFENIACGRDETD